MLNFFQAIVTSENLESVLADALGSEMQMFLKELNVGELRREFGDLGGLLDLVQLVGSISQCFDLNRFVGFDDEAALEKAAKRLSAQRQFIVGMTVEFKKKQKKQTKRYAILKLLSFALLDWIYMPAGDSLPG